MVSKKEVKLVKLDKNIMESLYKFRVLTVDQIVKLFGVTRKYVYTRMWFLKKEGYVVTDVVKGYENPKLKEEKEKKNHFEGKCYRLTTKGLNELKKLVTYEVSEYRGSQLEAAKKRIPYLLTTNDIVMELEDFGWTYTDSRKVKERFGINRGDMISGLLKYKDGTEYGFYTFLEGMSEKNIARMVREVSDYSGFGVEGVGVTNFIIFKRGDEGLDRLIRAVMADERLLSRVGSIKVLPYEFGISYLKKFGNSDRLAINQVFDEYEEVYVKRYLNPYEVNSKYPNLNCLIDYDGTEMYAVNFVDYDLKKVNWILDYRTDYYMQDGRKVLIILPPQFKMYNELFSSVRHVDVVVVESDFVNM